VDCLFRRIALRVADADMVQQRIGHGLGMLFHIEDRVEARMRIAHLRSAGRQVMQQRMHPGGQHVGVMRQIPGAVEETIGVAVFGQPEADEMQQGIKIGADDIRIAVGVPKRVEEAGHHPDERGLLLGVDRLRHRGSSRARRSRFDGWPWGWPGG
jgi:hypothetical protein